MTMAIGDRAKGSPPRAGGVLGLAVAVTALALYGLFGVALASHIHHRLDPSGAPLFYDFSAFYEAGRLALHGHAAQAYDDRTMVAAEQAAFPGVRTRLPWNYPPSFQMLTAALAALPYASAWIVWTVGTTALLALMAGRLVGWRSAWIVALAPAAAINVLVGQNGNLTAVLVGAGVLLLERRPFVGGLLLGLLSYKPQFAVLAPLLLLVTRQWRALAGVAVSGALLAAASLALLGEGAWLAFIDKTLHPAVFTSSSSDWRSIPSVQIMARTLGLPGAAGAALHGLVALAAIAGAAFVWIKRRNPRLRVAALAAATLLVTPYLRVYDLVLLALPIAVLALDETAAALPERIVLAIAWLLPAYLLLGRQSIQIGPLASLAVMGLVVWHATRTTASTKRLTLVAS